MEKAEVTQHIGALRVAVDGKCDTKQFMWAMGIFVTLSIILIGGLYARQSTLSESVASIKTTLQQNKETSANQGVTLSKIAETQTQLTITVGIMANDMASTARAMRALTKELRGRPPAQSEGTIKALIRSEIAWSDERKADRKIRVNKKGG